MKMNIKKISEISGFSPATVSNALNNKKGVNRNTAEQILKIAKECGYLDKAQVEKIRLVLFKKHGLVLGETPFFSALIDGVADSCRESGYPLVITNLYQGNDGFEGELDEILRDPTSAVLLLATELDTADLALFEECLSPVVLLDSWLENMAYDSVLINNTDSALAAVNYLLEMGHVEIGYLKSNTAIQNFYYRAVGYERALERQGIRAKQEYIVPLTPTTDGAYRDMLEYLAGGPKLPTAYFADNDIIALSAIRALKQHGVKIPGDVSVVGFDDIPFCEITEPPLTTIRVYKKEMGRYAVKQLLENIRDPMHVRSKLQLCTDFVERGSVRKL